MAASRIPILILALYLGPDFGSIGTIAQQEITVRDLLLPAFVLTASWTVRHEVFRRIPVLLVITWLFPFLGLYSLLAGNSTVYLTLELGTLLGALVAGVLFFRQGQQGISTLLTGLLVVISLNAASVLITLTTDISPLPLRVEAYGDAGATRVVGGTTLSALFLLIFVSAGRQRWKISSAMSSYEPAWARNRYLALGSSVIVLISSFERNLIVVAATIAVVLLIIAAKRLPRKTVSTSFARVAVVTFWLMAGCFSTLMVEELTTDSPRIRSQLAGFWERSIAGLSATQDSDASIRWRDQENGAALEAFIDRPLTGQGAGAAYRSTFANEDYGSFGQDGGVRYIHNSYLWLLAKYGVVITAVAIAALAGCIVRGIHMRHESGISIENLSAVFLIGIMVRSTVTPDLIYSRGPLLIGVLAGLILSASKSCGTGLNRPNERITSK